MESVVYGIEMEERHEPEFVRFDAGDLVEGVLLLRERITVKGKPVIRYTLEKPTGLCVTFLGTANLISRLRTDDIGHFVQIVCKGEDQMVKKGDNFMKVFEVNVSKAAVGKLRVDSSGRVTGAAPAGDGTEITDEDIPF